MPASLRANWRASVAGVNVADASLAGHERSHALLLTLAQVGVGIDVVLRIFGGGGVASQAEPAFELTRIGIAFTTAFFVFAAIALSRKPICTPPWYLCVPVALALGALALAAAGAEDPLVAWVRWLSYGSHALFGFVVFVLVRLRLGLWVVATLLAAAIPMLALAAHERMVQLPAAAAAFAVDATSTGLSTELNRSVEERLSHASVSGPFSIPNGLGGWAAMVAVCALMLTRSVRSWPVMLCALAAVVVMAASGQKGCWLVAMAALAVAWLFQLGSWWRRGALAALVLGIAFYWAVLFGCAPSTVETFPGGVSVAVRTEYAVAATRLIRERPLLGWGPGGFSTHMVRVKVPEGEETRFVHNDALELAVDGGLVSCLLVGLALCGLVGRLWFGSVCDPAARGCQDRSPRQAAYLTGLALGAIALVLIWGPTWSVLALAVWLCAFTPVLQRVLGSCSPHALHAACVAVVVGFLLQAQFDFMVSEPGLVGAVMVAGMSALAWQRPAQVAARPWRSLALVVAAVCFSATLALGLLYTPRRWQVELDLERAEAAMNAGFLEVAATNLVEANAGALLDWKPTIWLAQVRAAQFRRTRNPQYRAEADRLFGEAVAGKLAWGAVKAVWAQGLQRCCVSSIASGFRPPA